MLVFYTNNIKQLNANNAALLYLFHSLRSLTIIIINKKNLFLTIIFLSTLRHYLSSIDHSEHHTIHVPYKVHTIHHHHIKKVEVPVIKEVEVIKHVPIYKEVHVPVIKEVHVPVHVHHKEEVHHIEEDHHDYHKGGWY